MNGQEHRPSKGVWEEGLQDARFFGAKGRLGRRKEKKVVL